VRRLIRRAVLGMIVGGAVKALLRYRKAGAPFGDGAPGRADEEPAGAAGRSWPDPPGTLETEGPQVGDEAVAAAVAHPDDATLLDRVRSELFRDRELPKGDINLSAADGVVELRGQVEPALIEDIGTRVAAVEGVVRVENLLHAPGAAPSGGGAER
jgi:BON domain-containing protein